MKKLTEEEIQRLYLKDQKQKGYHARQQAKKAIIYAKAKAAGLSATDEEIEAYLKTKAS